jgi:hypothetical protein
LSTSEQDELADYLESTDVRGYAQPLRSRVVVAFAGSIEGREALGETWSIFGNLGGIAASALGRPKFLVREVRGVLARPDCTDQRSRARLDALLEAEAAGRLIDRRITIALTTAGPIVVDGNKRAAAIYELAPADLALPIFLLESAPGYPPLPLP